jgi:hypothetical protein
MPEHLLAGAVHVEDAEGAVQMLVRKAPAALDRKPSVAQKAAPANAVRSRVHRANAFEVDGDVAGETKD